MIPLGHLVHLATNAAYEATVKLEIECRAATDARRKKLVLAYLDAQRHRVLQLLACIEWLETDAAVLANAKEELGVPIAEGLARQNAALRIVRDARRVAHEAKAPRYDVEGALAALSRGTAPLPLVLRGMAQAGLDPPPLHVACTADDIARRTQLVYERLLAGFSYAFEPVRVDSGCLVLALPGAYALWLTIDASDGPWLVERASVFVRVAGDAAPLMRAEDEPRLCRAVEAACAKSGHGAAHRYVHAFAAALALRALAGKPATPTTTSEAADEVSVALWPPRRPHRLVIRAARDDDVKQLLRAEVDLGDGRRVPCDAAAALVPDALQTDGAVAAARRLAARHVLQDLMREVDGGARMAAAGGGGVLHVGFGTHGGELRVSVDEATGELRLALKSRARTWGAVPVAERLAGGAQSGTDVRALAEEAAAWDALANVDAGGAPASLVAPLPCLVDGLEPTAYAWLGRHEASDFWLVARLQGQPRCVRTRDGAVADSEPGGAERVAGMRLQAAVAALAPWNANEAGSGAVALVGGFAVVLKRSSALVTLTSAGATNVLGACGPDEDLAAAVAKLTRTHDVLTVLDSAAALPEGVTRTPTPRTVALDGGAVTVRWGGIADQPAPEAWPRGVPNLALVWQGWLDAAQTPTAANVHADLVLLRDARRVADAVRIKFASAHVGCPRKAVLHVVPNDGGSHGAFDCVLDGAGGVVVVPASSRMVDGVAAARTVDALVSALAPPSQL